MGDDQWFDWLIEMTNCGADWDIIDNVCDNTEADDGDEEMMKQSNEKLSCNIWL